MIDEKWVETCVTAGEFLYGYFPLSVLLKMYQTKRGYSISKAALAETVRNSKNILMEYAEGRLVDFGHYGNGFLIPAELEGTRLEPVLRQAVKDGNPYAELHLDDEAREDLLIAQGNVEFYIPTEQEIIELVENGYIRTPQYTALEEKIKTLGGETDFMREIWASYSTDQLDMMEFLQTVLDLAFGPERGQGSDSSPAGRKEPISIPSMEFLNELTMLINEFANSINLRHRRGWKPMDLFRKEYPNGLTSLPTLVPGSVEAAKAMKALQNEIKAMGSNVSLSTIDNFATVGKYGERRVVKVGPNDPCPCGSGKKYKRCHGRYR